MLHNPAAFYDAMRTGLLGPTLSTEEVSGCEAILKACAGWPLSWTAYAFATAYHETNATLQPVREAYWLSEKWRKNNLRYYPWYGRGYVQLTWDYNYRKADDKLGLGGSLSKNPDRAMEPEIAAKILRYGMEEGWFTRVKLSTCLPRLGPATIDQFKRARKIINGVDDDLLIARHALQFQTALQDGGWA